MGTAAQRWSEAWREHPLLQLVTGSGLRRRWLFLRQFSELVRTGTPLPSLFAELHRGTPPGAHRDGLLRVSARLRAGASLADAVQHAPLLFDPLTRELVRVGEQTGTLEATLKRRLTQLEEVRRMREQLLVSLLGPLLLCAAALVVSPLFEVATALQTGGSVDSAGAFYLHGLLLSLRTTGLGVGLLLLLPPLLAAANGQAAWDRLRLRLPIVAPVYRSLYAARLCVVLGDALEAGVEVGQSLQLAMSALQGPALSPRAAALERAVRQGGALAESLSTLGLLDEAELGLVRVAERTGSVPEQLRMMAQEHWQLLVRRLRVLALVLVGLFSLLESLWIGARIIRSFSGTYDNLFKLMDQAERT